MFLRKKIAVSSVMARAPCLKTGANAGFRVICAMVASTCFALIIMILDFMFATSVVILVSFRSVRERVNKTVHNLHLQCPKYPTHGGGSGHNIPFV